MGFKTFTTMYNSFVNSIMNYACAVWGVKDIPCCDAIQYRAMRLFLGVHRFTPKPAISGEMGWMPTFSERILCALNFYNRISSLDENRIPKQVLMNEFMKPCSWSNDLYNVLKSVDMHQTFDVSSAVDINMFKERKSEKDIDIWHRKCENLPKLRTYILFKMDYDTEHYLKHTFHRGKKAVMAQFRCGILPLKIETGRFTNIPVQFRICEFCNSENVEDESHILLTCSLYDREKSVLFNTVDEIYESFHQYENDVKMLILMNDEDLSQRVVDFLYAAYNKRNNILYDQI